MSQNPSRILKISCPSSTSLQTETRLNTISTAPSPQAFVVAASFSKYSICHGETTSQQPNRTFVQSCHRRIIGALCVVVRAYAQTPDNLKRFDEPYPSNAARSAQTRCQLQALRTEI